MKKLFAFLIMLAIAVSVVVALAAGGAPVSPPPELTISTTDGDALSLTGLLQQRELVVVNVFKSWQSTSRTELPRMEDVYEDVSDRVEIVAVTDESTAELDNLRRFKSELELSFPMGYCTGLNDFITVRTYPTTLVFNRAGEVVYTQSGYYATASQFRAMIDHFLDAPDSAAASYNLMVRDSENRPVPGVVVNFYTGNTCRACVSDSDGVVSFVGAPETYRYQVLSAPDGYALDGDCEGVCDSSGSWVMVQV